MLFYCGCCLICFKATALACGCVLAAVWAGPKTFECMQQSGKYCPLSFDDKTGSDSPTPGIGKRRQGKEDVGRR